MNRSIAAAFLVFFIAQSSLAATYADETTVEVEVYGSENFANVGVALTSQDLTVTAKAERTFELRWDAGILPTARIKITASGTPPKVIASSLDIKLPIIDTDELSERISVALVSENIDRTAPPPAFGSDLHSLNYANIFYRRRLDLAEQGIARSGRGMNQEDGIVLFNYAMTSKEMVLNHFVQPGPRMQRALGTLKDLLADDERLRTVFPRSKDRENAREVLAQFSQAGDVQREKLVFMVDSALAGLDSEARRHACSAATNLELDYSGEPYEDQSARVLSMRIKNLTNVVLCLSRDIEHAGRSAQPDAPRREQAETTLALMRRLLEAFEFTDKGSARDQRIVTIAARRSDEFANMLAQRGYDTPLP